MTTLKCQYVTNVPTVPPTSPRSRFERRYGVTRIGIFGSFARNEIREDSDIDIVVEMQPDLIKRSSLKVELESFSGKRIDVVRYRRGMNGFLKKRIDEEAFYV